VILTLTKPRELRPARNLGGVKILWRGRCLLVNADRGIVSWASLLYKNNTR